MSIVSLLCYADYCQAVKYNETHFKLIILIAKQQIFNYLVAEFINMQGDPYID